MKVVWKDVEGETLYVLLFAASNESAIGIRAALNRVQTTADPPPEPAGEPLSVDAPVARTGAP